MLNDTDMIGAAEDDDPEEPSRRDRKHDAWLTPISPRLAEVAEVIFEETERLRPQSATGRRPRSNALQDRHAIVTNLVANLVAVAFMPPLTDGTVRRVSVATSNTKRTRYDRNLPKQGWGEAVRALAEVGLVDQEAGRKLKAITTIEPTLVLRQRLEAASVTMADIGRELGGETIILKTRRTGDGRPGQLVDYEDTRATRLLRHDMERINGYLNAAVISVDGRRQPPFLLTRRYLTEVPQARPRFDLHGRIYDGFWIGMKGTERHHIRISGEACADCDFSSMGLRLAYLHAGVTPPDGDLYGGLEGLEIDPINDPYGSRRAAIKVAFNALLGRRDEMRALPRGVGAALGAGWHAGRFVEAASHRHAPIAHLFCRDTAIRLMHIESRILVHLLLDLIEQDVPALPIHDGILVPASKLDLAEQAMRTASRAIVGVAIPVKSEVLAPSHQSGL